MKDIEALKNIAPIICVPIFAIALVIDRVFIGISTEIENELIALALRFCISAVLVYIAFIFITKFIFRYATYGAYSGIELMPLPVIAGFICLAFGLYGVGTLIPALDLPKPPLNIFWHLGFLCYGFFLLTFPD